MPPPKHGQNKTNKPAPPRRSNPAASTTTRASTSNQQNKKGKQPCSTWAKNGTCPNGNKCGYSHAAPVRSPLPRAKGTSAQSGVGAHARTDAIAREQARVRAERQANERERERKRALEAEERARREQARELQRTLDAQLRARREQEERNRQRLIEERARLEKARGLQRTLDAQLRARREQEKRNRQRLIEERARLEKARGLQRTLQAPERARREQEERNRQRVIEEQERARLEEEARIVATKTTQHVLLGSIVTFGAGLDIQAFTTGFESCIVHVRGLPADAVEREIYALFTQQGIPKASLYLTFNRTLPDSTRLGEIKMAMNAEAGHALSIGLDELEFRDHLLSFEVGSYNIPGAMGASHTRDANVLTISWPSASSRYVVTYDDWESADQMVGKLNDSIHFGRRLKVEHDRMFPGRVVRVWPNSIKIDGLAPTVTVQDITTLAGPQAGTIRPLPPRGAPKDTVAFDVVRRLVTLSGCPDSDFISMEHAEARGDELKGMVKVRTTFRSWDQAKQVHDYAESHKPFTSVPCYLNLPSPLSYLITIPDEQYEAQQAQWLQLQNSVGDKKQCQMTQIPVHGKPVVRFRVSGSDQKAVGALKVRIESLAKGEKVPGWHTRFGQSSREALAFAHRVHAQSGAFMRGDSRQRQIKVYGTPQAVARARSMIEDELTRLAELEFTTQVPRASVRFFLAEGLPQLRELLGEENLIHFNPATLVLRTSGGDEARHVVSRVLEQSARSRAVLPNATQGNTCPTCFDEASAPIRLDCGHTYCSTCLRHFLTSAADSDKFPLLCMGDEAQCNVPIAIPIIEQFLPTPQLNNLLEATFRTYISQRASELKYCRTPDCEQIYRVAPEQGPRPTPVQCPACISTVCPRCHEDGHVGMTCEESRVSDNADEQERLVDEWIASQQGQVKRCPQCRVPIEKTEGCNHMECQCGAHLCWRCLGVFAADTIYPHMTEAHGGLGGEYGENREELAEQEVLLRQAEERRVAQVEAARRLAATRAEQEVQRGEAEAQAQAQARLNPVADPFDQWMALTLRQEEERRMLQERHMAAVREHRRDQERIQEQARLRRHEQEQEALRRQQEQHLTQLREEQYRQQQEQARRQQEETEQQQGECPVM